MSVAQKIFSNTLWQVLVRGTNIIIGVFNLALLTRILGQTGFGYYTTIFAFLQTIMIVGDLGLYLSLLREISTVQERAAETRATNNIFTMRLLASLLILLLAPLLINIFPYDRVVKTGVIFFSLTFFFQSLISTLTAVFSKKLAMPKVVLVDFFSKLIFLFSLLYFFKSGGTSLNVILLVNSLIYALSFLLFIVFLRKYVYLTLAWDFTYWRQIISQSWPLAVTVVLNLLYFKADTLILSAFKSPEEVALYGASYRVLEVLVTFPHMFMSLILPLLTAAWLAKNRAKFQEVFQHSFDFFCVLVVPMVIGVWLIGQRLMVFLVGPDFVRTGPILNILILATAGIFFGTLYTYMAVALGAQREMIKYFLVAAVVGLIGYFLLIPLYSYWGAAYMTLLVELLIWLFAYALVKKKTGLAINHSLLKKTLLAGLLMGLAGWFLKERGMMVVIISAGLIYVLMMHLTKAVDKTLLKNIFNRQN